MTDYEGIQQQYKQYIQSEIEAALEEETESPDTLFSASELHEDALYAQGVDSETLKDEQPELYASLFRWTRSQMRQASH